MVKRIKGKTIYPPIPRKTSEVDFDIYDFEMLFNDKPTTDLIRSGKTIGCFYIESPGMRSLLAGLMFIHLKCLQQRVQSFRPGVA